MLVLQCYTYYVSCAAAYLNLQHCLWYIWTFPANFGHFQVFTTVKICFTIKLCLTHKMTFNMESFNLFVSFVLTHATWLNILRNKSSWKKNKRGRFARLFTKLTAKTLIQMAILAIHLGCNILHMSKIGCWKMCQTKITYANHLRNMPNLKNLA